MKNDCIRKRTFFFIDAIPAKGALKSCAKCQAKLPTFVLSSFLLAATNGFYQWIAEYYCRAPKWLAPALHLSVTFFSSVCFYRVVSIHAPDPCPRKNPWLSIGSIHSGGAFLRAMVFVEFGGRDSLFFSTLHSMMKPIWPICLGLVHVLPAGRSW